MSTSNGDLTPSLNGRDPRGWFSKGNKIAAGNPMNVRMRELRRTLLDCATETDVRDLYASLMESARAGDTAAAKVLLDYLCGRPTQGIELSAPEGVELDLLSVVRAIMAALGNDPASQAKVGKALRQLELSHEPAPESSG